MFPVAIPVSANTEMMFYLGMNVNMSPFNNLGVRNAIYVSLDRDTITVSQSGVKVESIVQPSVPNPAVNRPYNPFMAKNSLVAAGYPAGFSTKLYTTPDLEPLATIISEYISNIPLDYPPGMNVIIETLPPAVFFSKLQNQELPFFLVGTPVDNTIMPPETLGRLLMSDGPQNFTSYNNSTFDSFLSSGQWFDAENCAFSATFPPLPDGLPIVPLFYLNTPFYTVRVIAARNDGPPASVPIEWAKTGGIGPSSGSVVTPFNIFHAGGDVTLTAPITHNQGIKFYVFKDWLVGTPPTQPDIITTASTVTFSADADKLATAEYQQITDLGPVMPLRSFNQPGLDHTVSVDIGIPVPGIEVTFRRAYTSPPGTQVPPFPPTPPTDILIGTAVTNASGVASITYTSNVAGIDQVYAFIDVNENGQYQEAEPRSPYPLPMNGLKYWLENFMTGGGHIKDGKGKPAWTFSGNAGLVGDIINGEFQIVNHKSKISYHTENFTFLNFFGPEGESPYASNNLVVFHAAFSNNKDDTQIVLFVVITDNGEPGKTDGIFIRVINPDGSWGECWVGTPSTSLPGDIPQSIDGGNFQIHNIK